MAAAVVQKMMIRLFFAICYSRLSVEEIPVLIKQFDRTLYIFLQRGSSRTDLKYLQISSLHAAVVVSDQLFDLYSSFDFHAAAAV